MGIFDILGWAAWSCVSTIGPRLFQPKVTIRQIPRPWAGCPGAPSVAIAQMLVLHVPVCPLPGRWDFGLSGYVRMDRTFQEPNIFLICSNVILICLQTCGSGELVFFHLRIYSMYWILKEMNRPMPSAGEIHGPFVVSSFPSNLPRINLVTHRMGWQSLTGDMPR